MLAVTGNGIHAHAAIGEIAAHQCRCSFRQIEYYRLRISGPLLDRIDIHVEVPPVTFRELSSDGGGGESSATIRTRVVAARKIQNERFRKTATRTNASMSPRQVKQVCQLDSKSIGYLEHAMEEMNFSARAHDRIRKVPRGTPPSTRNSWETALSRGFAPWKYWRIRQ